MEEVNNTNIPVKKVELDDLREVPVKVDEFKFVGVERTRSDLLNEAIKPCLKATTFGDLTQELATTAQRINRLDIFKDLRFVIDRESEGEGDGLVVRMEVKEKKYRVQGGTEVQKGQIGFGMGATIYNAFGRAEKVNFNTSLGTQSATPFSFSLTKPLGANPDRLLQFSCFNTLQHYIDGAKYKNKLMGMATTYSFPSCNYLLNHEFKYSMDWRQVFGIAEGASLTVRRSAGHSIKSAFSYSITHSSRDSSIFPTKGIFSRLSGEVAGLAGSVNYGKADFTFSSHYPLYRLLIFNTSLRLGHIRPLFDGSKLHLIDKYQMGGPLSIRGFTLNSLGPKDLVDSVGGDLSAEAALSLTFPLTPGTKDIVRGHLFANAGLLTNYSTLMENINVLRTQKRKGIEDITLEPNVSVGGGISVRLNDSAKLEMNITYPLFKQKSLTFHRGIQVGFGMEFL